MARQSLRFSCCGLLLALGTGWCCLSTLRAVEPPEKPAAESAAKPVAKPAAVSPEEKLREKLNEPTSVRFENLPLKAAIALISQKHDLDLFLDEAALTQFQFNSQTKVTFTQASLTLEQALKQILNPLQLVLVLKDEHILITFPEARGAEIPVADVRRVFPVQDLLAKPTSDKAVQDSVYELERVTDLLLGNDRANRRSTFEVIDGNLILRDSPAVAVAVEQMLANLRQLPALDSLELGKSTAAVPGTEPDPRAAKIQTELRQQIPWKFEQLPLDQALQAITEQVGIEIEIDLPALEKAGVKPTSPLTFTARHMTVNAVLKFILQPLDLIAVVEGGRLLITTPAAYDPQPILKFYPIYDLLALPPQPTSVDVCSELNKLNHSIPKFVELSPTGSEMTRVDGYITQRAALAIMDTPAVHADVEQFLTELRQAKAEHGSLYPLKTDPEEVMILTYEVRAGSRSCTLETEPPHIESKLLAETIQSLVAPASWKSDKQAYLQAFPDRIVIRQQRQVHREIKALLTNIGYTWQSSDQRQRRLPEDQQTPATGGGGGGADDGGAGFFNVK